MLWSSPGLPPALRGAQISHVFEHFRVSRPDHTRAACLLTGSLRRISVATITSFIARGLSTTQYFCYPALASSGVVLIRPGYAICK